MRKDYDRRKKYDMKNNLIAKSYKLDKKLVEEFSIKCAENCKTQSGELSKLMRNYVEQN